MNRLNSTIMFGAVLTLLFASSMVCFGWRLLGPLRKGMDPAEAIGFCGLVALGGFGLLTLLIGLVPSGLNYIGHVGGVVAILGGALGLPLLLQETRFKRPQGWPLGVVVAFVLALLFALVGALGPSDMFDWDSIAYHLAVPKIWLAHGQIDYIPFIHHSNFPGAIDNLFILGQKFGGSAGAKTFSVSIFALGALALFGLTRRLYGEKPAWIALLAWIAVPCALWEAGTAYIDVGHGLFAGLGILYAAELFKNRDNREAAVRAALCLALACASKYTGLQTLFACGLLALFARPQLSGESIRHKGIPSLALFIVLPLLIAGPWYARNVVNTGNPVYPFFYEVIGGKNWDAFSAKIYKEEQKTFGAGPAITDAGAAVLGLAYQPGRYTNPAPTAGAGMPTGALGAVMVAAWLAWAFSGKTRRFEIGVLVATAVSLAMWFVLSQQSRYLVTLTVPACVLAGAALERLRIGPLIAGLTALQAAYSLYIAKVFLVDSKLPVVLGRTSPDDYLRANVGFYEAAMTLNDVVSKDGRVALFDEVFGFFLDVPYFWANPGHSTLIPYAQIENGAQLADELKKLGFTHVYMNMSVGIAFPAPEKRNRWLRAAGLQEPLPYTDQERQEAFQDLRTKWRVLVAEAVAAGRFKPIPEQARSGLIFKLD